MWKFSGKGIATLHKNGNYLELYITPFGKKQKGHGVMFISKSNKTNNIMRDRQTEQMKTEVPFSRIKQEGIAATDFNKEITPII